MGGPANEPIRWEAGALSVFYSFCQQSGFAVAPAYALWSFSLKYDLHLILKIQIYPYLSS
jgi:hypothetical protein